MHGLKSAIDRGADAWARSLPGRVLDRYVSRSGPLLANGCLLYTSGKLDPTIEYPPRVVDKPRGRVRFAKKVHLPYGWLESRTTTHEEREALFGDDPMDASY